MKSKDFGIIDRRDCIDIFSELTEFIALVTGNLVLESFFSDTRSSFTDDFNKGMFVTENGIFDIIINIRIKEFSIKIIGDFSSVLDFRNHIFDNIAIDGKISRLIRRDTG